MRILTRIGARWALRHPLQSLLTVLGVAVGVAVVVAVDLANSSARRALTLSAEAVAGRATHQIVGGSKGLPETLYVQLRRELDAVPMAPIVLQDVVVLPHTGRGMRLVGVDPLSEGPFRPHLRPAGSPDRLRTLLTRPGAALLERDTAQELGLSPGESFSIRASDGTEATLQLIGFLDAQDSQSRAVLANWILVDIATAQESLGWIGRLTRIDLRLPKDSSNLERRIRQLLPPEAQLLPAGVRERSLDGMTRAFRLNLTAMSLLALMCGMYLIYNAMTFSVLRRRETIATLRAVGTTRSEILRMILAEGALVGAAGALLGGIGGVLLGRGLVQMVTRTISDVYFLAEVRSVALGPGVVWKAAGLGIGISLLATLEPAWEATRIPPRVVWLRSVLEAKTRRRMPTLAAMGTALGLVGGLLLAVAHRSLIASFAGTFALIVGASLWVPAGTVGAIALLRPVVRRVFGFLGSMAAQGVVASLSRTGVAVAALMIAISVTVGVSIMIDSFRHTMVGWLNRTLHADLYVAPVTPSRFQADVTLSPEVLRRIREHPLVDGTTEFWARELLTPEGLTRLVVVRLDPRGRAAFRFRERVGTLAQLWERFHTDNWVLLSEPLAYRRNLHAGDSITLPTDRGPQTFSIAGIYYDYGPGGGEVMIAAAVYNRYWGEAPVASMGVYLRPGIALDRAVTALRRATDDLRQPVVVRPTRALRKYSLAVFDRTFLITQVLRTLTVGVALIGVASALLALQLERAREVGVLRANGLTPGQLFRLTLAQTGLMGLLAGAFSVPMGTGLAALMVYIINRRSFGWTLGFSVDPGWWGQALLIGVGAALAAGLWPAWRLSRVEPAQVLREE